MTEEERQEEEDDRNEEIAAVAAILLPLLVPLLDGNGPDPDADGGILSIAASVYTETNRTALADVDADEALDDFLADIGPTVRKTGPDGSEAQAEQMADWLAAVITNHARYYTTRDQDFATKTWMTMRDEEVRDTHRLVDGTTLSPDEMFSVGGHDLAYPGQPVGPPDIWYNCRCWLLWERQAVTAAGWDLVWVENRRTPAVVKHGERYEPKPSEGRITKRRPANEKETKDINAGRWVRVAEDGKRPGDKGYKEKNPSKVRPKLAGEDVEVAMHDDGVPVVPDSDLDPGDPLPWHGVLAPEAVMSGDGRQFAADSLTWRELPLPLLWQERNNNGHDGAVVVGAINDIRREDGKLWAEGTFASNSAADEVIGLLAEGVIRGVSVDVDDAEMAVDEDSDSVTFTRGRICAATLVAIPAFAEAYVSLGQRSHETVTAAHHDKHWDGDPARFTPEEWQRSTIVHVCEGLQKACHKLPIRQPDGSLSEAAVYAAAARFNQVDAPAEELERAAEELRAAYKELGQDPPEIIASGMEFRRGPGWVTEPTATKRIHDYWTRPGEPGAAKIAWGTPGDWTRCVANLREHIGPRFLKRTCSEWHHDALGYWPGEKGRPGNPPKGAAADAVVLTAGAASTVLPAEWFHDPQLQQPTPLSIGEDGRIVGHLALWNTCHIGMSGVCVTPPHSHSGYTYFRTGVVALDDGSSVPVGQITMNTGHADLSASAKETAFHYDHTGSAVADIAAGEDEHGIWVAGCMRDTATAEERQALAAASLSGDWRNIAGTLELVAALAVNVPGFPVPRETGVAASGTTQTALIAAGIVGTRNDGGPDSDGVVPDHGYAQLVSDVATQIVQARRTVAEADMMRKAAVAAAVTSTARRIRAKVDTP